MDVCIGPGREAISAVGVGWDEEAGRKEKEDEEWAQDLSRIAAGTLATYTKRQIIHLYAYTSPAAACDSSPPHHFQLPPSPSSLRSYTRSGHDGSMALAESFPLETASPPLAPVAAISRSGILPARPLAVGGRGKGAPRAGEARGMRHFACARACASATTSSHLMREMIQTSKAQSKRYPKVTPQ